MAKRKRLTPARLDAATPVETALPRGVAGGRPPIADVAHDAAASAALTEVAQTLTEARSEGRLVQKIPLLQIDETYLVRDRMAADPGEMTVLMDSIRARGQQTAIEVTPLGDGRFGLISGWRRLNALRDLLLNTKDAKFDTILAISRNPDQAGDAYVAMVEENEIRVGLSFYERARIVARATDKGVYRTDRLALAALFRSVARAKRSKIGAFVRIVRALDDVLLFPTALTEKTGLALAQALESDTGAAARLTTALRDAPPRDAAGELAAITAASQPAPVRLPAKLPPLGQNPRPRLKSEPELLVPGLECIVQANGTLLLQGAALQDPTVVAQILGAIRGMKPVK